MVALLRRSLKTRVTLLSLAILVLSLWSLAHHTSNTVRTDLEQLLGDQQRSAAALVAATIDQELQNRLTALESTASGFAAQDMRSQAPLQRTLEGLPVLRLLFNGGYFVTDLFDTGSDSRNFRKTGVGVCGNQFGQRGFAGANVATEQHHTTTGAVLHTDCVIQHQGFAFGQFVKCLAGPGVEIPSEAVHSSGAGAVRQ